jgi:hypothetical protein
MTIFLAMHPRISLKCPCSIYHTVIQLTHISMYEKAFVIFVSQTAIVVVGAEAGKKMV